MLFSRFDPLSVNESLSCQCSCNGCAQHHTRAPLATFSDLPSTSEDPVSQIDAEIYRLESALAALRRRRNTFLPVARLPDEILIEIFRHCAPPLSEMYKEILWFQYSHVSHRWRATSVACPALWTCPMFTHPALAQEMLARSGLAPLDVVFFMPDAKPEHVAAIENVRTLDVAFQQAHRIQSVYLRVSTAVFTTLIRPKMDRPAPLLRSMSLVFDDDDGAGCLADVFQGEMPLLQHLRLRGCFLPPLSPLFSNLFSLALDLLEDQYTLTWAAFLFTLEALHQVTDLALDHVAPHLPPDDGVCPISLPQLQRLHISDVCECVANLLQCITLSPTMQLHVDIDPDSGFETGSFHLIPGCATFLSNSNVTEPLQCFRLDMRQEKIDLRVCSTTGTWKRPQLRFQSRIPLHDSGMVFLFRELNSAPWTCNIETVLIFASGDFFTESTWWQLFKLLFNCEHIIVVGSAVLSFLSALYNDAYHAALQSQPISLPRLRQVDLEYTGGGISREIYLSNLNLAFQGRGQRTPLETLCITRNASDYLPAAGEVSGVKTIEERLSPWGKDDASDDEDLLSW